jgi:hypothetical protein
MHFEFWYVLPNCSMACQKGLFFLISSGHTNILIIGKWPTFLRNEVLSFSFIKWISYFHEIIRMASIGNNLILLCCFSDREQLTMTSRLFGVLL